MGRILAFGNNCTGALNPSDTDPGPDTIIRNPTDVSGLGPGSCILWHSWTCTVIEDPASFQYWGDVPAGLAELIRHHRPLRLVGHDDIRGILGLDGRLYDLVGHTSGKAWADVAVNGLGRVYAAVAGAIHRFDSFGSAISGEHGAIIVHPALMGSIRLFALESRCFVTTEAHVFEIEDDRLRVIEAAEGINFTIVPGRRNRLGIISEAGDAHVFDTRELEPTSLEFDEDVRLLGLGSDFEVVVTETKVLSRGSNQFGQLGRNGPETEWAEINLHADQVAQMLCSRWATIIVMKDA